MAEASKTTREVPVTTYHTETVVTLTLTEDEAKALSACLYYVGGSPLREDGSLSVRGLLTDRIAPALRTALGGQFVLDTSKYTRGAGEDAVRADDERGRESMYIPARSVVLDYRARH